MARTAWARLAHCAVCGTLRGLQARFRHTVPLTGWLGSGTGVLQDEGVSLEQLTKRARRMPEDALFSGCTAAWLHGMDFSPCQPIEVTLPRLSVTSHLAGVRLTRSDLSASDTCEVRGLPATSRTRTVADWLVDLRWSMPSSHWTSRCVAEDPAGPESVARRSSEASWCCTACARPGNCRRRQRKPNGIAPPCAAGQRRAAETAGAAVTA